MTKTFLMIKPDAVDRRLVKDIIQDLNNAGLLIEKFDVVKADIRLINKHYGDLIRNLDPEIRIKEKIKKTYRGKYIVPMIVVGSDEDINNNIIKISRDIIGPTEPLKASKNTIRGKYGLNDSFKQADLENRMVNNLIHASDSKEKAEEEISIWFE